MTPRLALMLIALVTGCVRLTPPPVDARRVELDELARRSASGVALRPAEVYRLAVLLEAFGRAPEQAELIDADTTDPQALAGRAWRGWALGRGDWPARAQRAIEAAPASIAARALVVLLDAPLDTPGDGLETARQRVAALSALPAASRCVSAR